MHRGQMQILVRSGIARDKAISATTSLGFPIATIIGIRARRQQSPIVGSVLHPQTTIDEFAQIVSGLVIGTINSRSINEGADLDITLYTQFLSSLNWFWRSE